MEKTLGKEYANTMQRKAFLKDNCDGVIEKGYMKPFSTDKMRELKEELAEHSIEIGELEMAKKAATLSYNAELKPLKDRCGQIVHSIKERAEYVKEECYKFVDNDEKMVGFYNADGDLIESRPANPDELQSTIFQIKRLEDRKTGTDN